MTKIDASVEIDENEIHYIFLHSSGPGGQNINKVAAAVYLEFRYCDLRYLFFPSGYLK